MKLVAVVLDWAGTMIDFGSRGPVAAFMEVFEEFGLSVSPAEVRGPMGLAKRDHIAALMALPRLAADWRAQTGHDPGEADIDAVYKVFVPRNADIAAEYAGLVPGAAETVRRLKERGLKIGSTTGYTREIMARILPIAARQGYVPETLVAAGDVAEGRPSPMMMRKVFADLAVPSPWMAVKVDDTPPGIGEGFAAGAWTVGVAASGNEIGLSSDELAALPAAERAALIARAEKTLRQAGADFVIETVSDLMPVIDEIEARLARGERPGAAA